MVGCQPKEATFRRLPKARFNTDSVRRKNSDKRIASDRATLRPGITRVCFGRVTMLSARGTPVSKCALEGFTGAATPVSIAAADRLF